MTLHAYNASRVLEEKDQSFYGLVMAAMRRADTGNLEKLRAAFPEVWDELQARYNAPRGLLPGEHDAAGYRRDDDGNLYDPEGKAVPYA